MSPIEIFLIVVGVVYAIALIIAIIYVCLYCCNKLFNDDKDEYEVEKAKEARELELKKQVFGNIAARRERYNDPAVKIYNVVNKAGDNYLCFSKEDEKDLAKINSKLIKPFAYLEIYSHGEVYLLEKTYFRLNSFQRSKLTEINDLRVISLNV